MSDESIAERWPAGTAVEVRNLDRWLPAVVLSAGWWSAVELRGPAGERIEVEMAGTGQRAVVSEAYNGRANIRRLTAFGLPVRIDPEQPRGTFRLEQP